MIPVSLERKGHQCRVKQKMKSICIRKYLASFQRSKCSKQEKEDATLDAPVPNGGADLRAMKKKNHPRGNPGANLKSISHRCYLRDVAFE